MANIDGTRAWLDAIPLVDIDEVRSEQYDNLQAQITNGSGLELLLGLLSAERQAKLLQLALTPLSNASEANRAAVLQGTIRGLERARETVLELVTSVAQAAANAAGDTQS